MLFNAFDTKISTCSSEKPSSFKDSKLDSSWVISPIASIRAASAPYEPRCGFSAKTVQALIDCEAEFSYVDILANSEIRATLPSVSDWPTFPQVFVAGELIGGADIVTELNESGELSKIIQAAAK